MLCSDRLEGLAISCMVTGHTAHSDDNYQNYTFYTEIFSSQSVTDSDWSIGIFCRIKKKIHLGTIYIVHGKYYSNMKLEAWTFYCWFMLLVLVT